MVLIIMLLCFSCVLKKKVVIYKFKKKHKVVPDDDVTSLERTSANLEAHWDKKTSMKFRPNKHLLGHELVHSPATVSMSTSALGQFRGQ